MSDFLTIDGSHGEGGGQILRTALGLSIYTGTPVRITRVRAKRDQPGLARQHLTAVLAATEVCNASVTGAHLGSQEVTFAPGRLRAGEYEFDIGTAGSTTLVLQTLLPALLTTRSCDGPTRVTVIGGTHNPGAPPVPFLKSPFLPLLRRMGAEVELTMHRPGFYPTGGGRVTLEVQPVASLQPIELLERGRIISRDAWAIVAGLPLDIAHREIAVLHRALKWPEGSIRPLQLGDDVGPANVVTVAVGCEHASELFISFGQRGRRAEEVAQDAADQASRWIDDDVPVGPHLADQLLIPFALAGGGSFRTARLDAHAATNASIIERFLDARIRFDEEGRERVRVSIRP